MKRSPLKAKRDRPRRNEGRVRHIRVKPRPGAPPDKEERTHLARIAALPCLVCGVWPVTLHHVSSDGFKRIARSHKLIVPLCARHHQIQHGPRESVEALGHAGFTALYGIDLLVWAERAWDLRNAPQAAFWADGVTR